MNVKRIVAKTSREAMRQLREALGPDASFCRIAPSKAGSRCWPWQQMTSPRWRRP